MEHHHQSAESGIRFKILGTAKGAHGSELERCKGSVKFALFEQHETNKQCTETRHSGKVAEFICAREG